MSDICLPRVHSMVTGFDLLGHSKMLHAHWAKRVAAFVVDAVVILVALSILTAVRNLPKFFWYIFPLLDFLMGMAIEGDPRQRFSDRILGTVVVSVRHAELPAPEGKGLPQHFHSEITCRACGGVLQSAGQSVLQCQACGLIQ